MCCLSHSSLHIQCRTILMVEARASLDYQRTRCSVGWMSILYALLSLCVRAWRGSHLKLWSGKIFSMQDWDHFVSSRAQGRGVVAGFSANSRYGARQLVSSVKDS